MYTTPIIQHATIYIHIYTYKCAISLQNIQKKVPRHVRRIGRSSSTGDGVDTCIDVTSFSSKLDDARVHVLMLER